MQKPHNKEEMEMLLWSYIHDSLSLMERKEVETQLAESPVLQAQLQEIKETEALFAQQEEEQPSLRFSKNVMEAIAPQKIAPATRSYINKTVFRIIGGVFLTLIVACLVLAFSLMNHGTAPAYKLPEISVPSFRFSFNTTFFYCFFVANMVGIAYLADSLLTLRKKKRQLKEKEMGYKA